MSLGSWLRDRPHFIERVYLLVEKVAKGLDPVISKLGYKRVEKVIKPFEDAGKKLVFDCRTCGQCILHSTGMTCPMTCPKNLRNGPCGGTRANGHCEVKPEMKCVWVEAYERSLKMPVYGEEMTRIQPPVNKELYDRSAWITLLTGEDKVTPACWEQIDQLTLLQDIQSIWPQDQ
ncbi:MAG: methylenetetrahydrofolate reductase C-terminal domain-containing protein [Anaerolineales bacterium]|jgi:uncharacterized protein YdhG (YjbR/CyaY superfamily)